MLLKARSFLTGSKVVHNNQPVAMTTNGHDTSWDTDHFLLEPTNGEQSERLLVCCHGDPAQANGNAHNVLLGRHGNGPVLGMVPRREV